MPHARVGGFGKSSLVWPCSILRCRGNPEPIHARLQVYIGLPEPEQLAFSEAGVNGGGEQRTPVRLQRREQQRHFRGAERVVELISTSNAVMTTFCQDPSGECRRQ
jgi:hypothetical protein